VEVDLAHLVGHLLRLKGHEAEASMPLCVFVDEQLAVLDLAELREVVAQLVDGGGGGHAADEHLLGLRDHMDFGVWAGLPRHCDFGVNLFGVEKMRARDEHDVDVARVSESYEPEASRSRESGYKYETCKFR